jgi:hypothetical protein
VIEAKSVTRSSKPRLADYATPDPGKTRAYKTPEVNLVHFVGLRQDVNFMQTVLVVVEPEYSSSGQAVHGVSVWYILLVQSPARSGQEIPRKET